MSESTFIRQKTQDNFTSENIDVVKNSLLGDYNKNGNYVIADEIINELVLIKKVKTNTYNNSIFCSANLEKYGALTFEIVFKKNSKLNMASAELYLLETVEKVNGYIYNTIKTPLAKFNEVIDDNFVNKSLAIFNVTSNNNANDDDIGKVLKDRDFDFDIANVTARKNFTNILDKLTEKDFDKAYETYFNKRIQVLKAQNTLFSNEVLKIFNDEYNKISNYFLIDKKGKVKYKALNELLDNAIESVIGVKQGYKQSEEDYFNSINSFISEFSNKVQKAKDNAFGIISSKHKEVSEVIEQVNKNVKQEEKPVKVISDKTGSLFKYEHLDNIKVASQEKATKKFTFEEFVRSEIKDNANISQQFSAKQENVQNKPNEKVNENNNEKQQENVTVKQLPKLEEFKVNGDIFSLFSKDKNSENTQDRNL